MVSDPTTRAFLDVLARNMAECFAREMLRWPASDAFEMTFPWRTLANVALVTAREAGVAAKPGTLTADAQTLRLHMGELSAQELRAVQAFQRWAQGGET